MCSPVRQRLTNSKDSWMRLFQVSLARDLARSYRVSLADWHTMRGNIGAIDFSWRNRDSQFRMLPLG